MRPRQLLLPLADQILGHLHFLVFNKPPGIFTQRLLSNLSFSFFGVAAATVITFGVNTLAIRHIGPIEYGKWTLIAGIAELFVILPLCGFPSSAPRYLGARRHQAHHIVGTSLTTVFLLSVLFFSAYLLLESLLRPVLNVPAPLYNFAVLYGAVLVFSQLFQSFLQGLERFKELAFLRIASALVFALVIVRYLFSADNSSFHLLLWGNLAMLAVLPLVGLLLFRRDVARHDSRLLHELVHYGSLDLMTSFVGFFSLGSIDGLMINYFLGEAAVGLYAAYYMGFTIFTGRIIQTFSQTLLPMASSLSSKRELTRQALTMARKLSPLALVGNFTLIWLLFQVYGDAFPFDWKLAALMAASTTLYGILRIFGTIIASTGIPGARIGLAFSLSSGVLNVGFNLLLIPTFQLYGAVGSTIATSLVRMMLAAVVLKRLP